MFSCSRGCHDTQGYHHHDEDQDMLIRLSEPGESCPPTLHDVASYISIHKSQKLSEVYANCNYLVYLTDIISIEEVIMLIDLIKRGAPNESFEEIDNIIKGTVNATLV